MTLALLFKFLILFVSGYILICNVNTTITLKWDFYKEEYQIGSIVKAIFLIIFYFVARSI